MGGSGSGQGVMGQLATLVYGPWPTSELGRPGKPACFRRWQVCLSVSLCLSLSVSLSLSLSLSLSIYIYIYIFYIYIYILYAYINIYIYCMQNLGNVDFIHTGL